MIRYFDSSALVKRYVHEKESPAVARWLRQGRAATARFTMVEIASALWRRCRIGEISGPEAARLSASLAADSGEVHLVEFSPAVERRARSLLEKRSLRAADALQLASCLLLREEVGGEVAFVGYDAKLNDAARASGLTVLGAGPGGAT